VVSKIAYEPMITAELDILEGGTFNVLLVRRIK
jgi:hypothetical protein